MSPICAIPATSVEKTNGAMIILIRRRNKVVTMLRYSAIFANWASLAAVPSSIAYMDGQAGDDPEHQSKQDEARQILRHAAPKRASRAASSFTAAERFG